MRRANILLVDGDPSGRSDLREQVRSLGHAIIGEADNGAHGLLLARNLRPDLVLMDLLLPSISGLDVARLLAEEQVAPSLMFGHGGESEQNIDRMEASGVMGFLSKPARGADLGAVIQIAIARWRRLRELEAEVKVLNERMEARKLVGRAKAILMERQNLAEREAFRRIQAQSTALGKPVHEIARAIIMANDFSS